MPAMRKVIAYSGLSFAEVLELPFDIYLQMLKNAVVDDYKATPEGRDYLEKCARLKQKEPDVKKARQSGFMKSS